MAAMPQSTSEPIASTSQNVQIAIAMGTSMATIIVGDHQRLVTAGYIAKYLNPGRSH